MAPTVTLGAVGDDSIAPTVFALVERAVLDRPQQTTGLQGTSVRLELGYPPVRVTFGEEIEVGDDDGSPADVVIAGRLPDINALLSAPLTAGMPNPTRAAGRAALARLADGRVALKGSVKTGRKVLQLLSITA
jgi:hypothetical protein